MANPLAVLSGIFGGLSTVGGQGAEGALTGRIEGEALRRRFQTEDEENRLRMLRGLQMEQSLGPQYQIGPHGQIVLMTPGQMPQSAGFLPTPPMTPQEQALEEQRRATADWRRTQAQMAGQPKAGHQETETNLWAQIGQRVAAGIASPQEQQMWARHQRGEAKAQAPIRVGRGQTLLDPETYKPLFTAPAAPLAGDRTRETVTTSTKITPRKPIATGTDTFNGINKALPDVVNEITGAFAKQGLNFNVPGEFVTLPSGKRVRKEEVISQALLDKFGVEAAVKWEGAPAGSGFMGRGGGKFVLVKAWEPAQREPVETIRTTGPAGRGRGAPEPDDEEE